MYWQFVLFPHLLGIIEVTISRFRRSLFQEEGDTLSLTSRRR